MNMDVIEILKNEKIYPGYPTHQQRLRMLGFYANGGAIRRQGLAPYTHEGAVGRYSFVEYHGSVPEHLETGTAYYQKWIKDGRPTHFGAELYLHLRHLRGVVLGLAISDSYGELDCHGLEFAPSFTGEYARDASGRPVHPLAKEIFAANLAVEGPGAYWNYGPNLCADAIVLGISGDRRLKTIVVERRDTGDIALPGGHCNKGEEPLYTALRELKEETSVSILGQSACLHHECVYEGIVADPRTTINAWPETSAYVFILRPGVIDFCRPHGQDDAASASIRVVDDVLFRDITRVHYDILQAAVSLFKRVTGLAVGSNGTV